MDHKVECFRHRTAHLHPANRLYSTQSLYDLKAVQVGAATIRPESGWTILACHLAKVHTLMSMGDAQPQRKAISQMCPLRVCSAVVQLAVLLLGRKTSAKHVTKSAHTAGQLQCNSFVLLAAG